MKMFKGFDKDMKCGGFQYKVGEKYEEDRAELCKSGFHACEFPLDVFEYYPPASNRFCEVDLFDIDDKKDSDSKRCGKGIIISAEIGIKGIIDSAFNFIYRKADWGNKKESNSGNYSVSSNSGNRSVSGNSGYYSVSSNSGDYSVSSNSGYQSVSSNSGNYSVSSNSGNRSVSGNSGYQSVSSNSGDYSVSSNSGNYSVSSNSGNRSVSGNSGYYSVSSNSGDYSVSTVDGKQSVALAVGVGAMASGALGCWIVLSEWDEEGNIICVKSHKVDGKTIKPNILYALKNGRFVKA